jgi:hypothetical protein
MRKFILSSVLTVVTFVLMAVNVLADTIGPGI